MKKDKIDLLIEESMFLAPDFKNIFMSPANNICGYKLTPQQHFCLMILHNVGPISMSELSINLRIPNQQVTRIIDCLVDSGLVERIIPANNRRIILAQITDKGIDLLIHYKKVIHSNLIERFAKLTDEELDSCLYHIQKANEIFKKLK